MKASEVSIKDILSRREFSIVAVKSYETKTFIMSYQCIKQRGFSALEWSCVVS